MDKDDILQFEADDASKTGINGKQVFFTKRINGETIHNKELEEDSKFISENIELKKGEAGKEPELFIEFKNLKYTPKNVPQKGKNARKVKNNSNTNKNKQNSRNKTNKIQPLKNSQHSKNKKRTKKKNKSRKTLKIIAIIIILIGIAVFTMISPIFDIENIEVTGNEKIDSATIISLSGVQEGKNIFRISKKDITKKIKENAYISDASIERKLPGTLEINIKERKIAYQVKVINSFVYIDYQGYLLETSSQSAEVPQIEGFLTDQETLLNGKKLADKDITFLNTLLKIMESAKTAEISQLISKIIIQNNEYILELNQENKIAYIGNANNLTNQMTYIKIILDNEKNKKGKIFVNGDINGGFRPYFREE